MITRARSTAPSALRSPTWSATSRAVLALLLTLAVGACSSTRTVYRLSAGGTVQVTRDEGAPASRDEATEARAWLWTVRRGEGALSYVLGTMHIDVPSRQALPPPLDQHLTTARIVVLETDPRDTAQLLRASTEVRPLSRRQGLDRLLPRATWLRVAEELSSQLPVETLKRVPPSVLAHHFALVRMAELEAAAEGRTPTRGAISTARLEHKLYEQASRAGRALAVLETPADTIAALSRMPQRDAVALVRAAVDEPDATRTEQQRIRDAYLGFDAQNVHAMLASMTPEARRVLLAERHRAWATGLEDELAQGGVFVAVSLSHLLGDSSLLAVLVDMGFEVRRIGADANATAFDD